MNVRGSFKPTTPKYDAEAGQFLLYTDCPVWRYTAAASSRYDDPMVFGTATDPTQQDNLAGTGDPNEERMRDLLVRALNEMNVRDSQFERLGLTGSS